MMRRLRSQLVLYEVPSTGRRHDVVPTANRRWEVKARVKPKTVDGRTQDQKMSQINQRRMVMERLRPKFFWCLPRETIYSRAMDASKALVACSAVGSRPGTMVGCCGCSGEPKSWQNPKQIQVLEISRVNLLIVGTSCPHTLLIHAHGL